MSELELVGREAELVRVGELLERCAQPSSSLQPEGLRRSEALQIEGAAGMGKTALWREALGRAGGHSFRVLTARPVEIEAKLSFAALGDLLEPVLDDVLPALAEPQRRALEVALLLAPARARPDPRGVAAAFLAALRELARDGAVAVGVDDLQWLDSPSYQALAFAARRLESERVAFLVTVRTGEHGAAEAALPAARLERMQLGPLGLADLGRLIEAELGNRVPRPLLGRIHAASGGNPFFAREQARALRQAGLRLGRGTELPVPGTLRALVEDRLALVPPEERETVLAVAALAAPTREVLVALAGGPEGGWPPLVGSLEAGVVEVSGAAVRFTHPLLRSVLYAETPLPVRQELHGRLAALVADAEESARQLALSAAGPGEAVAARLEEAGRLAAGRGAPSSAGELFELALEATPTDDRTGRRARASFAARQWTAAGDTARAIALLEAAVPVAEPGCGRAASLVELGRALAGAGDCRAAAALYGRALEEPCGDLLVRVSVEQELGRVGQVLGDVHSAAARMQAAAELAGELGDPAVLAEALSGLAVLRFLLRDADYRATMDRALALVREDGATLGSWWLPEWQDALLLVWEGRLEEARTRLERLRGRAAERGDEQPAPFVLGWLARIAFRQDDWDAAAALADEACDASISAPGERAFALVPKALVEAQRGNAAAARETGREGLRLAEDSGMVAARISHLAVQGALELSLGDHEAAHRLLAPLPAELERHGFAEPAVFRFHPDLVETLAALGELEAARERLAELEGWARRFPGEATLAAAARCRGLVAAGEGDEEHACAELRSALAEHERAGERFERGRSLLAYGIVLRRARSKRGAREALEEALGLFEPLGAAVWAERTRGERSRISGAAPRSGELTETEQRIVALATSGRSNKQIAAELHITVRTVESNLTRVYRKLGVSSRGQLTQLVRS